MRNAFDTDSGWGRGFSALAAALSPDPTKQAHAAYYARAAGNQQAQADLVRQRMGGATGLSQAFLAQDTDPRQVYAQAALAGDDYLTRAPASMLGLRAATGAAPAELSSLFVGAGNDYRASPVGAREGWANQLQQSNIAAGPGYARVAEDRRQWNMTPTMTLGADGQLGTATRADVAAGRAMMAPSETQVQGATMSRLAAGLAAPNADMILAPGSVISERGQGQRRAVEPISVMRDSRLVTIPRGDIRPTDQQVSPNDSPADMIGLGILAGQPADPATVASVRALPPTSGRGGGRSIEIGGNDAKALKETLTNRLTAILGGVPDDALLAQAMARASQRWQLNGNAVMAAEDTVREIEDAAKTAGTATTRGNWNPLVTNQLGVPGLGNLPAPPARAAAPGAIVPPAGPSPLAAGLAAPAAAAAAAPAAAVTAVTPSPASAAPLPPPKPNDVVNGWRYTGPPNDPAAAKNRANWARVPGNTR